MDIGQNFKSSKEMLWKNKRVTLPSIIVTILSFALFFSFLLIPGVQEVANYSNQITSDYEAALQVEGADVQAAAAEYEAGQDELANNIISLITLPNVLMVILGGLLLLVLSFYALCLTHLMIADVVKNHRPKLSSQLRGAWKYFWSYLFLHLACIAIIIVPIMYVIIIISLLSIINPLIGVIGGLVLVVAFVLYAIYAIIRLIYSIPIMFMEGKKTTESMRQSYYATRGPGWRDAGRIFGVLILVGIGFAIINAIVGSIFPETFSTSGWIANTVMAVVSAFVNAFMYLFLFKSYADYKAANKKA